MSMLSWWCGFPRHQGIITEMSMSWVRTQGQQLDNTHYSLTRVAA
jgi:hypothetical protein